MLNWLLIGSNTNFSIYTQLGVTVTVVKHITCLIEITEESSGNIFLITFYENMIN